MEDFMKESNLDLKLMQKIIIYIIQNNHFK